MPRELSHQLQTNKSLMHTYIVTCKVFIFKNKKNQTLEEKIKFHFQSVDDDRKSLVHGFYFSVLSVIVLKNRKLLSIFCKNIQTNYCQL